MLPRFYAPNADGPGTNAILPAEESRHAAAVLRLRVGDDVAVFDGRGHEWHARVMSIARSAVTVRLEKRVENAREPRVRVILLQAVLKGDHMDAVVRDATMLGAAEIWPVMTTHTVVSPKAATGAGAQARWHRVAVASAKQCRRAVVPVIRAGTALLDALEDARLRECDARILLAEPIVRSEIKERGMAPTRAAALAVGPEGGWAQEELGHFARVGFASQTLGTLTLRADAAAVVAISVLRERWSDL